MFQKLKSLSRLKKIGLGVVAITVIGIIGSHSQPPTTNLDSRHTATKTTVQTHSPSTSKPQPKASVITTQTITETQTIPYTHTTVNTAALPKGTSKITTPGTNGVSTLTYKLTFTDGKQTNKELLSQVTTTPPVMEVTSVGTYEAPTQPNCPNGTYVNSVGNTVCNPYVSNAPPAGATARCVDGTYSFSQSHSGTCSHHGGVSVWL